jgi:predicted porin
MVAPGEGGNAAGSFRYYGGRLGYRAATFDVSGYAGATRIDATGADLKQNGVYGSYTFGSLGSVMLSITNSSYLSSKQTQYMGGVKLTFDAWLIKASYNRLDQKGTDAANVSIGANDVSQFALGFDYLLSKRTALYANAAHLTNKGAARFAIPGGPAVFAAGSSSTGYELGLRHSF